MVHTVLEKSLGTSEFHASSLHLLSNIGKSTQKGVPSVVEQLQVDRSWGTVKTYLNAFTHFIDFLESREPAVLNTEGISALGVSLKGSLHTVTKFALEELQHRKLNDRNKVIHFRHISSYLKTNVAHSLSTSDLTGDKEERAKQVHRIGRHILLQMQVQNGKRTGIFSELKISDVDEAKKEGDGYVILVGEGKTFRVSGAAGIFCSVPEFETLQHFLTDQRPLLKPSTDQVFCRLTGERASVSEIGEFLADAWADFGSIVHIDVGHLTSTLIRKTIISRSREDGLDRDEQVNMATHMDHSVQTADRHYDVSTGARLTAQFRKVFEQFHDPLDSEEEDEDDAIRTSDRINEVQVMPMRDSSVTRKLNIKAKSKVGICSNFSHNIEATRTSTFGKPDLFSLEDKTRLYRCCSDLIDQGKRKALVVTKAMIHQSIMAAGSNFADLLKTYTLGQLCNRVRCEIRKK